MAITPHLERACLKGKLHRKKLVLTSPFFSESKVAGALKGSRSFCRRSSTAGLLLDRKRLVLRLSVVEHLSKIARVERLAADWAVDKVL
ncbi:hypothetical protein NKI54_32615 [Mesorhizobium sp. M0663]|uniref:hypothetical protein n=1 Tax=unclassified Mesorhizobium TaxID=325217 RepID=UPI0033367B60